MIWVRCLTFFTLSLAFAIPPSDAGDWPQILGPFRSGNADKEESIPNPQSLAKPIWRIPCGQGYAGVAIAGGRVVLFDRIGESERVRAIRLSDGEVLGNRLMPQAMVAASILILDRVACRLCTKAKSSSTAPLGSFTATNSTMAATFGRDPFAPCTKPRMVFWCGEFTLGRGDKIIIACGGKKEGGVVCLGLQDGLPLWVGPGAEASYSSPILLPATDAAPAIVFAPTRLIAYGLHLDTGSKAFEFPFGQRGPTVNAATPIRLPDGSLFLTASYGIGACLAKPKGTGIDILYQGETLLSSQYSTPVLIGKHLYASDGRADMGGATLKCIDPVAKKVVWEVGGQKVCHLIAIDQKILSVAVDGTWKIFEANPSKFTLVAEGSLGKDSIEPSPPSAMERWSCAAPLLINPSFKPFANLLLNGLRTRHNVVATTRKNLGVIQPSRKVLFVPLGLLGDHDQSPFGPKTPKRCLNEEFGDLKIREIGRVTQGHVESIGFSIPSGRVQLHCQIR